MTLTSTSPRPAGARVKPYEEVPSAGNTPTTPTEVRDLVCAWVAEGMRGGLDGPEAGRAAFARVEAEGLTALLLDGFGGYFSYQLYLSYRVQGGRQNFWQGRADNARTAMRHDVRALGTELIWEVIFWVGDHYVSFGDMTRADCAWQEQRAARRIAKERQRKGFWGQLRISIPEDKTARGHFSATAIEGLLKKHGFRKVQDAGRIGPEIQEEAA